MLFRSARGVHLASRGDVLGTPERSAQFSGHRRDGDSAPFGDPHPEIGTVGKAGARGGAQAVEAEQAEFVRPALIKALAALSDDTLVRRALVTESRRGLDFFRSAVIDALGATKGPWATESLVDLLSIDGPLLDDAMLALGRRGDRDALPAIISVRANGADGTNAMLAARCLLGEECAASITAIRDAMVSGVASPEAVRSGAGDLALLATTSDLALTTLVSLVSSPSVRDDVTISLGTLAVLAPERLLKWLETASVADRDTVTAALVESFGRLEEDFAEEEFFTAARAAYWAAPENSPTRTVMATLIDKLEF